MDKVERVEGLVINAPEFFADKDFMAWLNDPDTVVMTWHCKGQPATDWSDTVVLVDPMLKGEGADSDMPPKIWAAIVKACKDAGLHGQRNHIPVRLTNLT
jgi:hypothetical protein